MANQLCNGLLIEDEILFSLNKKKYKHLTPNMANLIRDMFGVVSPGEKIKCIHCEEFKKPDLAITVGKVTKYLSIKSGKATDLHGEHISTVIPYLRSLGISERTLKTYCLYQFGDKTLDGSGERRMEYHDVYFWLRDLIKEANAEINGKPEVVMEIIDRVMFQGVDKNAPKADYIYCGDLEYGLAISRDQVYKYLSSKSFTFIENLHIGPILIKPHARYVDRPITNDYARHKVDFYWPKLNEDVRYIYKRYTNSDLNLKVR